MNRTCDVCSESKADSAFRKFARGRRKTCMACESGSKASDGAVPAGCGLQPSKPSGHMEVAPGLGVRASIEAGALHLEQDRQDGDTIYTHEIVLAPHEVRQLADWIAELVRMSA